MKESPYPTEAELDLLSAAIKQKFIDQHGSHAEHAMALPVMHDGQEAFSVNDDIAKMREQTAEGLRTYLAWKKVLSL